ncbi:MAG: hypothetical protein LKI30_05080 [Bifidobacterium crudilactis]|jgi:hypothetical protein|nr:hypothetical protein [Bifidobacterium crudilactis]
MKHIRIVAAKIRPEIFQLITTGQKRFEVRNEDFEQATVIQYISTDESHETLGFYEINRASEIKTADRELLSFIASVPKSIIRDLSLGGLRHTYVANIGDRIDNIQDYLIREGADDDQLRREFGYNQNVINVLRQSLTDKGPTW